MAGAEENVVIRSGDCTVTLLPALGGKISSLRVGAVELLQSPLKPLRPRTQTMAFSDSDASGWDECLPSVAAGLVQTDAGPVSIPDHGDLWRVPWQVLHSGPGSATLQGDCFSLPLQLTRSLTLAASSSGWQLHLRYSLINRGAYRVPWSWCAHPLFAVEDGDRVLLPREIRALRLESSAGHRLGEDGDSVSWPRAKSRDLSQSQPELDLSVVHSIDSGIGDKLFAGPFGSAQESWLVLERMGVGLRLTVRFEPSLTPYLGLWLCFGGWPDSPDGPDRGGEKQFCVAPEPATAPVDSLAKIGTWSRWLESGETFHWPLDLFIDRIGKETYHGVVASSK